MEVSMRSLTPTTIRRRAIAIGLSQPPIIEFCNLVDKWVASSGHEWTCERLKSILADIIRNVGSGEKPSTPWVRKNRRGNFSGILGWIQREAQKSEKNFFKVVTLLRLYTSFISKRTTLKQERKFLDSVTDPGTPVPAKYHNLLIQAAKPLRISIKDSNEIDLGLVSKLKPNHEPLLVPQIIRDFSTFQGKDFLTEVLPTPMYLSLANRLRFRDNYGVEQEKLWAGEVFVHQEPGFKARFFAFPRLWAQLLMDPLKEGLLNLLKEFPWDGTHDQSIADQDILCALNKRQTVYCFDLSDATNTFPFELELSVLRQILPSKSMYHLDFFEQFCKLPWKYKGGEILWSRGQPLGTGPSFPLFALTHGLLLYGLNGNKHNGCFYIIGDDVVILDDALSQNYATALEDLGLKWSKTKSLFSKCLVEFAGHLFFKGKKRRLPKWKATRDDNILDIVRDNGPWIIKTLPPNLAPFLEFVSRIPQPYGFGWNPNGLTYLDRFAGFEELLYEEVVDEKPKLELNPLERELKRFRNLTPEDQKRVSLEFLRPFLYSRCKREDVRLSEEIFLQTGLKADPSLIKTMDITLKDVTKGLPLDSPIPFMFGERSVGLKRSLKFFKRLFNKFSSKAT